MTTDDPEVARHVTHLRFNGEDRETGEYHCHGFTALLDNVQAAVLDVKLRHLPKWIEHRRHIAGHLPQGPGRDRRPRVAALRGGRALPRRVPELRHPQPATRRTPRVPQGAGRRDPRELAEAGLEARGAQARRPQGDLPETEAICREVISLPMSAETTEDDAQITIETIKRFFAR